MKVPSTPETPWPLVVYSDEIGVSPLKEDTRKCEATYWLLLELGEAWRCNDNGWFVVASPRSTRVKAVAGGHGSSYVSHTKYICAR